MILARRTAIVTGGASGVGRAVAVQLAEQGALVLLADRDKPAAEQLCTELAGLGHEARFGFVDLADAASVDAFAVWVGAQSDSVDVLVNSAGWDHSDMPFSGGDPGLLDKVMAINLLGPLRLMQLIVPLMLEASGASIINIVSDAGRVGVAWHASYAAAKGGMIAFTKSLAREVASSGLTVNCVSPGMVDTPMLAAFDDRRIQSMLRAVPLGRLATADEIANAVTFLAGPQARYITGQVLSVNGGLTMM